MEAVRGWLSGHASAKNDVQTPILCRSEAQLSSCLTLPYPIPSLQSFGFFSRRSTSRSTTSRMKAALRLAPTSLSMRSPNPSGSLTTVDFTLSAGLPIRLS